MAARLVERAWRESAPESVEQDLAALWRELAAAGPGVTRAVMANLIVFRYRERRARYVEAALKGVDAALEAVVGLHPSRAIVIELERGDHDAHPPSGAGVGISVFGTPAARYGVERIVVQSACAEVSLPSIVRRFLRGDRPTSLWWTEDLSRMPPSPALVELARQFLYDSRAWRDVDAGFHAVAALSTSSPIELVDLNWRRLDPIRRVLVHAAQGLTADAPTLRATIAHRPGDAALAWLLAGWMASRLQSPRRGWPTVTEARYADEILTLTLSDGKTTVTASLNGHRAIVTQPGVHPAIVPAPRESGDRTAEAIAAELRMLTPDSVFADALAALAAFRS